MNNEKNQNTTNVDFESSINSEYEDINTFTDKNPHDER